MSDKLIVFDLGGVIFNCDVSIITNSLSKFSQKQSIFDNVESFLYENQNFFADYEKGLISSVTFYNKILSLLEIKDLSFERFSDIWNSVFSPKQSTIDLISNLSKKYTIALLSNTNELHFNWLYTKYQPFFDNNFQNLFLSYEMNERKPEEEIYNSLIKFYNIDPANIFFTDDNEKNVEAAKKTGIKSFIFKDFGKLKEDLNIFGVIL